MYAKAGGFAEEVLSNIKTVVAFGKLTSVLISILKCFRRRREGVRRLQELIEAGKKV